MSGRAKINPKLTIIDGMEHLNFTFWNIHGYTSKIIGNKFFDDEFLGTFGQDHIVALAELHMDSAPSIPGFTLIPQKIRKKIHKGPKISGGLALFAKTEYAHLVKLVQNKNEDSIWVKLRKEDTGDPSDIYLGTIYLSPSRNENSNRESLASLESFFQELNEFRRKGDFNAHTSKLPDFIESDKLDEEFGIYNDDKPLLRNSEDNKIPNDRGKYLLDLCKAYDMLIVNGRKTGDMFGKYTSFQWNGSRVVDYVLSDRNQIQKILDFKVGSFRPWLSDHCPLQYKLSLKRPIKAQLQGEDDSCIDPPDRFFGTNHRKTSLRSILN